MKTLAINGGSPTKTKHFPCWPMHTEREMENLKEVLESNNWWRMTGTKVEKFEKDFAKYHNAKHCICVTNGTHAIELALAALEIGAGDEVIIPAFTFISTATAPIYSDVVPVPVDVDPDTFCMAPEAFEKAITPRTKAVIPVHMAGHACDMDKICEIARKHGLKIIEDAAHAHGAEWEKRKIGTFGDVATFSFQNGKIVTCGEGGAVITNNDELYKKAYLMHGVGRPKNDRVYEHLVLGNNYRMNEFQAAILIAQLERLEELSIRRQKNAVLLNNLIKNIKGIVPQAENEKVTFNTHYMYMFYFDKNQFGGISRQQFVDALIGEGIPAFIAYPVVSKTTFFAECNFRGHIQNLIDYKSLKLPNAEKIADEVVWLPHFTLLGDEQDVAEIVQAITKIQNAYQRN